MGFHYGQNMKICRSGPLLHQTENCIPFSGLHQVLFNHPGAAGAEYPFTAEVFSSIRSADPARRHKLQLRQRRADRVDHLHTAGELSRKKLHMIQSHVHRRNHLGRSLRARADRDITVDAVLHNLRVKTRRDNKPDNSY